MVDNRINGYNSYIVFENAVLKVAQDTFTIFHIFSFHSLHLTLRLLMSYIYIYIYIWSS